MKSLPFELWRTYEAVPASVPKLGSRSSLNVHWTFIVADAERSPEELVREGWDRASFAYRPSSGPGESLGSHEEYRDWLSPLFAHLPPNSRVLDLGCGCGVPATSMLAERFDVTGVDVSKVQIERARELVPKARFVREDMTRISFGPASFEAIVALYSIIHVPLAKQRPLLDRVSRWLAAGGWLVLITGHEAGEGTTENWLGSGGTMFWSHADASTYRDWLLELGFEIVDQNFIPEETWGHELFRAKKPARDPPMTRSLRVNLCLVA